MPRVQIVPISGFWYLEKALKSYVRECLDPLGIWVPLPYRSLIGALIGTHIDPFKGFRMLGSTWTLWAWQGYCIYLYLGFDVERGSIVANLVPWRLFGFSGIRL